jgi:hypothetical protein
MFYLNIKYSKKEEKSLRILYNLFQNCGFLFFHKNICFITERPVILNLNEKNQLHSYTQPALSFKDGYSLWYSNGVRMEKDYILTPAEKLDPKLILKEKNAEVRAQLIKKIGINKAIKKLGAKSIEKNNIYELLNFDIIDGTFRPYLKMINPSTKEFHVEGVHPDCNTIEKALAWRNRINVYKEPLILT